MNVKTALEKLLNARIVDKNNLHGDTKKLDLDLYTARLYQNKTNYGIGDKKSEPLKDFPKFIDLGGTMEIKIMVKNKYVSEVRCSENTKIKEIFEGFHAPLITFGGDVIHYEEDKYKSLKDFCVEDGNMILISDNIYNGGGEEFYIDDDLCDPSYDYDFRGVNDGNQKFYRGGLEYKRPCGWNRYALKVKGKYENDKWIDGSGESNGEWAVSYHGTLQDNMKSIYNNGYRIGTRNAYGKGVYCSPNIETAAEYSKKFTGDDGKTYKIVLQNRVKPSSIKRASDKGGPSDYWYIENEKDIRPYSICVKQFN